MTDRAILTVRGLLSCKASAALSGGVANTSLGVRSETKPRNLLPLNPALAHQPRLIHDAGHGPIEGRFAELLAVIRILTNLHTGKGGNA